MKYLLLIILSVSWFNVSVAVSGGQSYNYKNSQANYNNSEANYENSSINYRNSPVNFDNTPYGYDDSRGIYDTSGYRIGYGVEKPDSGINYFSDDGKRHGYRSD